MANQIDDLMEGPVGDMLREVYADKDFKYAFKTDNIGGGPSGMVYLLAWKVAKQQEQIDLLIKMVSKT